MARWIISPDADVWEADTSEAVSMAAAGDVLVCPHIRSYNLAIRLLMDICPDMMVFVRLRDFRYWPRISFSDTENDVSDMDMFGGSDG